MQPIEPDEILSRAEKIAGELSELKLGERLLNIPLIHGSHKTLRKRSQPRNLKCPLRALQLYP